MNGFPKELVGAQPGSRLWREAVKEIAARQVREYSQWRDNAEREYLETRPRRVEPVAKRYFSF
jgi:hypothetical protein